MIAGNLFEIIFGHAFNGFFTLFFQWAEGSNMKASIGREPGIFRDWYGKDGAQAQINGFPSARHKSFTTKTEAQDFLLRFLIPHPLAVG